MTRLVRLDTCAPQWPWLRQTPAHTGRWGCFQFRIDDALDQCEAWVVFESLQLQSDSICPPDRTVFITGEPSDIGRYHQDFLAQFEYVISGRGDLSHPRQIRLLPAHPWFVERDFDELVSMPPPIKSRSMCVLISDKAFTAGHRRRLEFVQKLRLAHPSIDVLGRGFKPFASKWDTLLPYRYTVVLENSSEPDFLTEKMPDAWLAFCYPFYAGSANAERYVSSDAFTRIQIDQPEVAIAQIGRMLADEVMYADRLPAVLAARQDYLRRTQFFANLAGALEVIIGLSRRPPERLTIRPNKEFLGEEAMQRAEAPPHATSAPTATPNERSAPEVDGDRNNDSRPAILAALLSALSSIRGKKG